VIRTRTYPIKLKALLLLTAFVVASLVKPAHILVEHHDLSHFMTPVHHDVDAFNENHHFDCQICEFEFCFFITNDALLLPVADYHLLQINSEKPGTHPVLVSHLTHLLRAPPVV
jgi:hypothetical protein